jgi:hypothetical protein
MAASDHPLFTTPDDLSIPIWRYMDFTKFVSMLANSGVYFPRADLLGDPFEGSFSAPNKGLREAFYQQLKTTKELRNRMPEFARQNGKWTRKCTYINCWHMSHCESAGMWRLYARSNEAVAIRSTIKKLKVALDADCFVGAIQYINYSTTPIPENNTFWPFLHKRLSFSHECELRAVIQDFPITDGAIVVGTPIDRTGIWKTISLSELIDHVYVAPTAPRWFSELTEHVLRQYKLKVKVSQSSLDDTPFF